MQESEAEFLAAMPSPSRFDAVLEALKRSPLMLELPITTPGLAAVADLVSNRSRRYGFLAVPAWLGAHQMPTECVSQCAEQMRAQPLQARPF
jgi:hypothetical protein